MKKLLIVLLGLIFFTSCSITDRVTSSEEKLINSVSLDPGEVTTVLVSNHCGYQTLEIDINEATWSTDGLGQDTTGNPEEPGWPPTGGATEMELELVDSKTLLVTASGTNITHIYNPNPNSLGCD